MNDNQVLKIVEEYCRTKATGYGEFNVSRVQDQKTVWVEKVGADSRSVMMNEYKVDGVTYWAGYSSHSQTIFVSRG